jgi:hypothetical protein
MHTQLDKLENKIRHIKIGGFLFNKYYNIKDLYWALFYVTTLSALAGFGNAFPGLHSSITNIFILFGQGFLNNIYLSLFVNLFYVKIVNKLSDGKHFRRNGNILWSIVMIVFVGWHYFIGTENPIQANILPGILSLILTNYHINTIVNKNK